MTDGFSTHHIIWIVLILAVWFVVIPAVTAEFRRRRPPRRPPSALDELQIRYSAGEISAEEFDEAYNRLRDEYDR